MTKWKQKLIWKGSRNSLRSRQSESDVVIRVKNKCQVITSYKEIKLWKSDRYVTQLRCAQTKGVDLSLEVSERSVLSDMRFCIKFRLIIKDLTAEKYKFAVTITSDSERFNFPRPHFVNKSLAERKKKKTNFHLNWDIKWKHEKFYAARNIHFVTRHVDKVPPNETKFENQFSTI